MSQKRRNCLILYKTISKLFSKVALIRLYISNFKRIIYEFGLEHDNVGITEKKDSSLFLQASES